MKSNLLVEAIFWGLSSGIVAGVYRGILYDEEFFNPWFRWAQRFEGKWFFKPLVSCGHCTAGQIALWSFTLLRIVPAAINVGRVYGLSEPWPYFLPFRALMGLFCLIIAISTAILTGKTLSWYLQKKFK